TGSSSYTRELINIPNGTAYIGSSGKNDFFIEAKVTYPANSVKSVFVDAINGNDNNKGFESHPYKTINKAISEVKDCGEGVINIKEGIYRENIDFALINNKCSFVAPVTED